MRIFGGLVACAGVALILMAISLRPAVALPAEVSVALVYVGGAFALAGIGLIAYRMTHGKEGRG